MGELTSPYCGTDESRRLRDLDPDEREFFPYDHSRQCLVCGKTYLAKSMDGIRTKGEAGMPADRAFTGFLGE